MTFEYKVVPAPTRGQKGKGIKGPEARFANTLELHMNTLAADGWEFLRAETLPSEERSGLTSTTTTYRTVLVYRRSKSVDENADGNAPAPAALPAPSDEAQQAEAEATTQANDAPETAPETEDLDQGDDSESTENAEPRDQDDVVRAGVDSLKQD
ncbi:DUF4177 domain-containing protein [Shimia sp. R10_1]|uniref:DUF4177 domain-containing protein n=1 Tax=Shimia sp. R10_1 TaxID=2821095 RepID=UPI001ADC4872|nr:DUF4177 domain-containing protein [Shimia sp. R10_1]MBO9472717.1 DUF4177 domain-containing protein [Shimia sp. R10_1]